MAAMHQDLTDLQNIVRRAGREVLLPRFNRVTHTLKDDGSLLTEADLASNDMLENELTALIPGVNYLSEEMSSSSQREILADKDTPFWCVDPLDGTSNFASGVPVFGICAALIADGQPQISVIYDPIRDECFTAERGRGAWINDRPLEIPEINFDLRRAIALVDFKRLTPGMRNLLVNNPPYGSQRNVGSCALEWAWMAAGRGHIYLHGGQKLWDMAAGVLILEEAGGYCQTLDGDSVFSAQLEPRSVLASPSRELFNEWSMYLLGTPATTPLPHQQVIPMPRAMAH
jgi:myo-inositol-1(or 4)-monophosphatase